MTTITAKTILRSRNAASPDKVLSTLLLRYPLWIHAEGLTHRILSLSEDMQVYLPTPSLMADKNLSRNAASARAIPIDRLIQDIRRDPAVPLHWGKNERGMQATETTDAPVYIDGVWMPPEMAWGAAQEMAIQFALAFAEAGYHKQVVNRLLMPFGHITVLVSATEWDNFLELRDHGDAEPHMRMLAQEVRKCLEREDDIQTLQPGDWHMPFVDAVEWESFDHVDPVIDPDAILKKELKLSAARCASTSYKTVEGFDMTLERAELIWDKLIGSEPIHASPFEHVAQADEMVDSLGDDGDLWQDWRRPDHHGNFVGFRQLRHNLDAVA